MAQTYIVILRGINVSGHRPLRMADLREDLEGLNLKDVRTYIQSGNIIFQSDHRNEKIVSELIRDMLLHNYRYEIPVIAKKAADWQRVVDQNPFASESGIDLKHLHVTFLSDNPSESLIPAMDSVDHGEDRYEIIGDRVYLHCPNGYARTKLSNTFIESKLKLTATTRNWKTILKLHELSIN